MSAEPFVGRSAELSQLRGLVDGLAAGVGGVALIEGEQGIGKSALLRAGLAGAASAGCLVLWATADELGQCFPLSLMADCLESVAGAGDLLPAGGGGVLAGDPVLAGIERVLALVDQLCAASPVVLVAEDLQWADDASVLAWRRLSRAAGQSPLLVAGSCRAGTGQKSLTQLRATVAGRGGTLIDLRAMPDADVSQLVGGLVGARPGRRLVGLVSQAGGNPLYAGELTDALAREHRISVHAGEAELTGPALPRVPTSLAAAIEVRLGFLDTDVVTALRWAAVLGQEFFVRDLQLVTGRTAGDLIGVIEASTDARVLAEAGQRLRFRHGLIRQALYEAMPESLRMALHSQAARALAASGVAAERVAGQLTAAREVTGEWVLDWLTGSAPVLIYRAPQVAADLLAGALEQLADDDPRREGLEASLVRAAYQLHRDEEVERAGRPLMTRTEDPDLAAEIAWLVASALNRSGKPAQAALEAASALARPGVSDLRAARLEAIRAVALTLLGELDRAAQIAESALATGQRSGDSFSIGYANHALATVNAVRIDLASTLGYIDQALAALGDQPLATEMRQVLLSNRASTLSLLDRQNEAIASGQMALALAERAGSLRLNSIRTNLAFHYFMAGKWDDALAELEQAVGSTDGFPHDPIAQFLGHGIVAMIAGHRDDRKMADEHLSAVRDLQLTDLYQWANACALMVARAMAAEQAGQPSTAADVLATYFRHPVGRGIPDPLLMPMLTRLAMAAGDMQTAVAAAQAMAEAARAEQAPGMEAVADHCRGLAAGDPAPILTAAAHFEKAGRPVESGHAMEDAAVLAASRGDESAAREGLARAVRLYQDMGAQWDVRRADARLRPYGIRRGRSARSGVRPVTGWDALTPTENTVAYLVASGRSNPDVAAELFLSRNTVQTHVSHILAKLGARSRAEIIREALMHPQERQAAMTTPADSGVPPHS